jgi:hypothetical protein|tara:strand:- start:49 stop:432 length:384 start_codon:yes stop_codon:yes gene_type:complete
MISNRTFKWGIIFFIFLFNFSFQQESNQKFTDFTSIKKRVYNFTKVEFITEEGEFNDAICTLVIKDLDQNNPPYVAIYYKRDNSNWFTESLYRKRVRYSFQDGLIKLDRSNFWDWYEVNEIKIVVIY